jgi:hypothetical protein
MKYYVLHIGTISGKVCIAGLSMQYGSRDLATCNDYVRSAVNIFGCCRYFLVDEFLYDRFWRDYLS